MKEQEASSLSFRTILWLCIAVIVFIARVVVDVISLASNTFDSSIAETLRFVFGLLFIFSCGSVIWYYAKAHSYHNRLDFFNDFSRLILLLFISVLPFASNSHPENIPEIILDNTFLSVRIFTCLYTVVFLYRALSLQRTSQTQRYTRVILIGTFVAFVTSFIASVTEQQGLQVIVLLLAIVLALIMYLAVKRRTWVQLLAAKEKKKLLLLVFLGLIASLISAVAAATSDSDLYNSLHQATYGFPTVMTYACVFLCIFCERVFWTILLSLPNSSMVERRTFEFSSVAYLNRIAAESNDLQKLYSTITALALQATRATSAWCFIRSETKPFELAATERITVKQIDALNDTNVLSKLASTLNHPISVEYISEHPDFAFLSRSVESFAQSMIIAPLRSGKDMVGAVIVVHSQPFSFESDDVQAIGAFASSASVAIENARLVEDSLEKERYHRELMVGREIQRKLLPQESPSIPGYEVFAASEAAMEVGGDYYDYYILADGTPCILIADVSGKGISAAFYMAKLKGVSLALARHASTARELVEKINQTLFGSMERQMYITLTAVHLRMDGTISVVRAGHTQALLLIGGSVQTIKPKGLGIGLANPEFFSRCIQSEEIVLQDDSMLLLFTDGINEARNNEGEEFGIQRLEDSLLFSHLTKEKNVEVVASRILREVEKFSNHSLQHDDMTLIVIQRKREPTVIDSSKHIGQQTTTVGV